MGQINNASYVSHIDLFNTAEQTANVFFGQLTVGQIQSELRIAAVFTQAVSLTCKITRGVDSISFLMNAGVAIPANSYFEDSIFGTSEGDQYEFCISANSVIEKFTVGEYIP